MKFRKKPVIIEAVQFTGKTEPIREFMKGGPPITFGMDAEGNVMSVIINTLEGEMTGSIGDWIIKGVKGEFYPCKPDIFEQTYEPVEGEVNEN